MRGGAAPVPRGDGAGSAGMGRAGCPGGSALAAHRLGVCACGCVWEYVGVCGCIWVCMGIYGHICMYVDVCGCMCMYMDVCGYIWTYMHVCGCIWIFMDVYACMWMYVDVYGYIGMYVDAHGCTRLLPMCVSTRCTTMRFLSTRHSSGLALPHSAVSPVGLAALSGVGWGLPASWQDGSGPTAWPWGSGSGPGSRQWSVSCELPRPAASTERRWGLGKFCTQGEFSDAFP